MEVDRYNKLPLIRKTMAIKVQRLNLPWKPLFYTKVSRATAPTPPCRVYSGTCKWNPNFNSIYWITARSRVIVSSAGQIAHEYHYYSTKWAKALRIFAWLADRSLMPF